MHVLCQTPKSGNTAAQSSQRSQSVASDIPYALSASMSFYLAESAKLEQAIKANPRGLGYGG
jgi:hypothetical protein